MDYIIIRKVDFTKNILLEKLNKYLFNYLKNTNTYIFDIHKTIEYGDNNMDEVIFNFINKNHDKVNIIYGNGWINILSNRSPSISILNWPVIDKDKIKKFYNLLNNFEEIIAKENQILWVEKSIFDKFKEKYNYLNINKLDTQGIYYKILIN